MLCSLLVFYSVPNVRTGANEDNERKSPERTSGIGGR